MLFCSTYKRRHPSTGCHVPRDATVFAMHHCYPSPLHPAFESKLLLQQQNHLLITLLLSLFSQSMEAQSMRRAVGHGQARPEAVLPALCTSAARRHRGLTPGRRRGTCLAANTLCCLLSSAELPQPPSSQPASARLLIRNIF